jgi:hypothetical protein
MTEPRPQASRYETPFASVGRCLIGNLNDISEALAIADGEAYR